MALPKFTSMRQRRNEETQDKARDASIEKDVDGAVLPPTNRTSSEEAPKSYTPGVDIKKATSTRKHSVIASSVLLFISVIFLILVIIGGTYNKPVLRNTWFFSLNLSNIFPTTIPNSELINSIVRTLGLHDFYNVSLWGYCEGYTDTGTTYCSPPQVLYYFDPVEIIVNELVSGATIALPAEVNDILNLVRIISHLMFGFFLTGICMNFVSIPLVLLPLYSRWWSLPIAIFTFIGALLTTAATIIATAYAIVLRNVLTSEADLNISAYLGAQMFGFMWTATACALIAFIIQLCLACCCASRRDVRTGRKRGNKKAYGDVPAKAQGEKGARRYKLLGRRQELV